MISYQSLINKIIDFYDNHLQVKKVGSDFREQLENFATKDEKYPLVYICPVDALPSEMGFTTEINLEIYCFDIIQKDRANINVILSDCHLILNDLYNWFMNSNDYSFDIVGQPTMTPLNNDLLDYAAGWVMTVTCSINNYTDCQVPLNPAPQPINCNECIKVTFTHNDIEYSYDLIKSGLNYVLLIEPGSGLEISYSNNQWELFIVNVNGITYSTYLIEFIEPPVPCPLSENWQYAQGDILQNIFTSYCIE